MNKTVKQIVADNREQALAAKTHSEIKAFIESIGCATAHRWKKACEAIVELGGVDYYTARDTARAQSAAALANAVTHETTLFVDAKARCQRFAICGPNSEVLWHGIFFEDDHSFSYGDRNEQSACECAAARKAVWLASKIKEAVGAAALRLNLKVDAQWLVTLSGKAAIIAMDAKRFNIELNIEWVPGSTNPADRWTTAIGFKKWNDNDLAGLAWLDGQEPERKSIDATPVAPVAVATPAQPEQWWEEINTGMSRTKAEKNLYRKYGAYAPEKWTDSEKAIVATIKASRSLAAAT